MRRLLLIALLVLVSPPRSFAQTATPTNTPTATPTPLPCELITYNRESGARRILFQTLPQGAVAVACDPNNIALLDSTFPAAAGWQRACNSTGSVAAGAISETCVTWTYPYASANAYTLIGGPVLIEESASIANLLTHHLSQKTTTQACAVVFNQNAEDAKTGTLCLEAAELPPTPTFTPTNTPTSTNTPTPTSTPTPTACDQEYALERTPGTCESTAPGVETWAGPLQARVSDNVRSTLGPNSGVTYTLSCRQFGTLPADAVSVRGITLKIEKQYIFGSNPMTDNTVQLFQGFTTVPTPVGENKASGDNWCAVGCCAVDCVKSYGGATDLWGVAWTVADLNDSDHGGLLKVNLDGTSAGVDAISEVVNYCGGTYTPTPTSTPTATPTT